MYIKPIHMSETMPNTNYSNLPKTACHRIIVRLCSFFLYVQFLNLYVQALCQLRNISIYKSFTYSLYCRNIHYQYLSLTGLAPLLFTCQHNTLLTLHTPTPPHYKQQTATARPHSPPCFQMADAATGWPHSASSSTSGDVSSARTKLRSSKVPRISTQNNNKSYCSNYAIPL